MTAAARPAVLISGFYGFGNLGDEAVLAGVVRSLRAHLPEAPLIVLSADPPASARTHQVEAIDRRSPALIVRALRRSRLFLSGGGSLIQDATSLRSSLYYLGLLRLAQAGGLRTMVYAAGLGPLRRPLARRLTRSVLNRTDSVTVRDRDAAALVRSLGVRRDALVTADPTVLLGPVEAAPADVPVVGVVVRPWGNDAHIRVIAEAVTRVARSRGARVMVLPFYPAVDGQVSRRIAEACGGIFVDRHLTPADALALISTFHVLVGVRLHALLFAAIAGVPPVGIAYDPKVTALHRDLEVGEALPFDAGVDAVTAAIEEALEGRERLRSGLLTATARLRNRALIAVEEARRLYGPL